MNRTATRAVTIAIAAALTLGFDTDVRVPATPAPSVVTSTELTPADHPYLLFTEDDVRNAPSGSDGYLYERLKTGSNAAKTAYEDLASNITSVDPGMVWSTSLDLNGDGILLSRKVLDIAFQYQVERGANNNVANATADELGVEAITWLCQVYFVDPLGGDWTPRWDFGNDSLDRGSGSRDETARWFLPRWRHARPTGS